MPARWAGRVVDGGDDLDEAILHADLDPEAAELAAGAGLQVLVVVRDQVGRVRVEAGQHAPDGVLHQRLVIDVLDVVLLDLGEDFAERAQLLERQALRIPAAREHALTAGDRHAHEQPGGRERQRAKEAPGAPPGGSARAASDGDRLVGAG